ncbi:MAG: putative bifunctional diguanylate cyclase/phosphodiesterase [Candidatus Limnocylindrales bacterium]
MPVRVRPLPSRGSLDDRVRPALMKGGGDQRAYQDALHQTALGLMQRLDQKELLLSIATRAAALVGTEHAYVYLADPAHEALEVAIGIGVYESYVGYRLRCGEGVAGRVWASGNAVNVADYDTFAGRSADFPRGEFRAVMGVPLTSGQEVVGVLGLSFTEPERRFEAEDVEMVGRFAQLASIALDNSRLYSISQGEIAERTRAAAAHEANEQRYRLLFEANPLPMWVHDVETLDFLDVNETARQSYGWTREEFLAMTIDDLRPPGETTRLARSQGDHGEGVTIETRHRRRDGSIIDVEVTTTAFEFQGREMRLVLAHDVTARRQLEEQLTRQAFHDDLTRLPNRSLFHDRLEHSLSRRRHRESLAVLFIDLDRFKVVNDSLGHGAGDRLLEELAGRLSVCVRSGDTLARLGGDEFTVLLEDLSDSGEAVRVVERILEATRAPFYLAGHEVVLSASVGVAFGLPGHTQPDDVMRQADVALYRAKSAGGDLFVVFDEAMNAQALDRLDLETDLRHALERDELRLHYQPEVDLANGHIVGVEALVRWAHPQRGLLPPEHFIPMAEEIGLIMPIGQWVLDEACRQARTWLDDLPKGRPPLVSVNLSVREFQQADVAERVGRSLAKAGLPASMLRLEITESMILETSARAESLVASLRERGVGVALDDFGTGYSSLSAIRRLRVDTLKIDRSFIAGIHESPLDVAIAEAIVRLAHALGMDVVAEGIESDLQRRPLRAIGVDRGQGFHFGRPVPAAEMRALLLSGEPLGMGDAVQRAVR